MVNYDRRQFLVGSATLAASAAALSAFGCSPQSGDPSESQKEPTITDHNPPVDNEEGGKWVSAACWHNCGGRCMNKVLVKEGVVIRQKTDDTHEDTPELPQQRGCVRGRAQQQQCFGADRILHPLKRKGWQPGGGSNSNGANRGKDEWEAISWDDAIKYCADEFSRIKAEYGGEGFFSVGSASRTNVLAKALGAGVTDWQTSSMGTYQFAASVFGLPFFGLDKSNDRFDMPNADYIVMYASNPTWSAAGTPIMNYIRAHEAGVKFVCVDPLYNASAQMLDAEWLPIYTGTDMAFLLGVAYEMLRLDEEEGGIVDWDFIHKYSVGFDTESMPEAAKTTENFLGYVKGEYDGIPKTVEWAEARCGVPAEQITSYARMMGKANNVMTLHNFAHARNHGADQVGQLLMTISVMGGHIGKSGNCCGSSYHANCGNSGPAMVTPGAASNIVVAEPSSVIGRTPDVLKAIAAGGGSFKDIGNAAYGAIADPKDVTIGPVKCIIHGYDAYMQTTIDQNANIAAHRAVDFVVSYVSFMTSNARYSDIILPVTTEWERPGGVVSSNREFISAYSQVTEPLGEAKSDQEIETLLLQALGMDADAIFPISAKQAFFDQVAGSKVLDKQSGGMNTLVTITDADIAEWGVNGTAQQGVVSLADFIDNGGYQVERSADDGQGFIGYADFINDPEGCPLSSASGKFEIYCQVHDDIMHKSGYANHEAYKPYPVYVEPPYPAGYASTFADNDIEGGVKGDYPYQMYNPHYMRRSHSVFDNCSWLREAWPNPVFIATADAEAKGILDGDTVLVSAPNGGKTLRKAAVLDIIRPGVVGLPHGAWVDVDEETGIDTAGSENYLIGAECSGLGVSGYNNGICNIEKYTGIAIQDDCDKEPRWSGDMDQKFIAPVPMV